MTGETLAEEQRPGLATEVAASGAGAVPGLPGGRKRLGGSAKPGACRMSPAVPLAIPRGALGKKLVFPEPTGEV